MKLEIHHVSSVYQERGALQAMLCVGTVTQGHPGQLRMMDVYHVLQESSVQQGLNSAVYV